MARQHLDLLDLLQVLQGVQGRGAEAILQLLGAEVGVGAKAEAGVGLDHLEMPMTRNQLRRLRPTAQSLQMGVNMMIPPLRHWMWTI